MKSLILVSLLGFLCLSAAADWQRTSNQVVNDDHSFIFKVALKQQNMDYLDSLLWQIADMNSPFAGKYLTHDQIADIISLPEEQIQQVEQYLTKDSGKFCDVDIHRSLHRDFIYVNTCAAQAKLIFPNLDLAVYENEDKLVLRNSIIVDIGSNATLLGVPQELHQYIEAIHDVTDLPITHYRSAADPSLPWATNTKELTIKDMIEFFGVNYDGIDASTLKADDGQVRQGVIELNHAGFSQKELVAYQKRYGLPINPINKVVGTEETSTNSVEASLDVQTITGISGNLETWDFVFNGTTGWIDVLEAIMGTKGAPKVYSVSWVAFENSFSDSQLTATNNAFLKFGAAGFTFVEGSGDWGPNLENNCTTYVATFPSSSPYVLSVGGTKINKDNNIEEAWMHSGGGFSGRLARPSYQDGKVNQYLSIANLPTDNNTYPTTGRAFPDISAFGAFQPVLANGSYQPVGGTSAATPQIAAMIALINVHRYQKGMGPVGVANPTLWKLDNVGFDVTIGQSYAANPSGYCPGTYLPGFPATKGWDAITGLGSPDFNTILQAFLSKSE